MPALIALSVFISVFAAVSAVVAMPRGRVQQRLAGFRGMAFADDEPTEVPRGFVERVARPAWRAALRMLGVLLPTSTLDTLRWRLTLAGDPISVTTLLIGWAAMAIGLPVAYFVLVASGPNGVSGQQLVLLLLVAAIGAYLPHVWLRSKAKSRQKVILKSLPDAIDLLTTSVEAGLGIDAAMGQVAEKVKGPIATELRRVLREMALGASRRDALKAFADRTQIPDVMQFVNAIIQAEQMGVSLGQVVRVQSDQMRIRRRQRAEAQAYKAPVKMVFPLVLFIFPAIFVVILGPAAIQIMKSGFGG